MYRTEVIMPENFFKFKNYFFSTSTSTTSKLDDVIPVTYFSGLQEPVLELQTNSMTVYRERYFGKTAPSRSFVENDHEAKLVLN